MNPAYEPRFEDQRLLIGAARFVDDEIRAGQAYGVFVVQRLPEIGAAYLRGGGASRRQHRGRGARRRGTRRYDAVSNALPVAEAFDMPAMPRVRWQAMHTPLP